MSVIYYEIKEGDFNENDDNNKSDIYIKCTPGDEHTKINTEVFTYRSKPIFLNLKT